NRQAHDVEVYATSLKAKNDTAKDYSDVESFLPMNFKWSYSGSDSIIIAKSISPSIGKHCDFGHIIASAGAIMFENSMGGTCNLEFILDLEFDASTRNSILKPGDYLLEVIVAAGNATAKRYSISFCYDGGWSKHESDMFSKHFIFKSVDRL
ncbi:MAG: hypothetical protein Q7U56_08745, partial [Humidesulfovibrio sp.]|nr:hypothetical protein [Humidesulfovibrio sp.]